MPRKKTSRLQVLLLSEERTQQAIEMEHNPERLYYLLQMQSRLLDRIELLLEHASIGILPVAPTYMETETIINS